MHMHMHMHMHMRMHVIAQALGGVVVDRREAQLPPTRAVWQVVSMQASKLTVLNTYVVTSTPERFWQVYTCTAYFECAYMVTMDHVAPVRHASMHTRFIFARLVFGPVAEQ